MIVGPVIVREGRIQMLFLAAREIHHENPHAAQHGENHHQKEEDRPPRSVTTGFHHIHTAGRAGKILESHHDGRSYRNQLNVELLNLAVEIDTVGGHHRHTCNPHATEHLDQG